MGKKPDWFYATHLPVLLEIGKHFSIKKILEFGCGKYSTGIFLNKSYYPELEILESIESIKEWYEKIKNKFKNDNRFKITFCNESALSSISYDKKYDIVFIDNFNRREIMENLSYLSDIFILHDGPDKNKPHRYIGSIQNFKYYLIYTPDPIFYKGKCLSTTVIMSNKININEIKWNFQWNTNTFLTI